MLYKYVTENNLEERQNYMYSQYAAEEFLESYFAIRNRCVISIEPSIDRNTVIYYCKSCGSGSTTEQKLSTICAKLLENIECFKSSRLEINQFTKTFEVHKRIYEQYDDCFRPIKDSGYCNYKNYILCAIMLEEAYAISLNYKYLSCLLKVNDSIISICAKMEEDEQKIHKYLLERERGFIEELCGIHGILSEVAL